MGFPKNTYPNAKRPRPKSPNAYLYGYHFDDPKKT